MPMDYDVRRTAQAITDYCSVADGFVVTIPYESEADKRVIADAVNVCTHQRPTVRFLLSNTDTSYQMYDDGLLILPWAGYAGSFNYEMGEVCGRYILTRNLDLAITGSEAPANVNEQSNLFVVYFAASERDNAGIKHRSQGILKVLRDHTQATVVNYPDEVAAQGESFVIALGVGAAADLATAGIEVSFQCGDDQNLGELTYYGQTVYTQGLQATAQLYSLIKALAYLEQVVAFATERFGEGVAAIDGEAYYTAGCPCISEYPPNSTLVSDALTYEYPDGYGINCYPHDANTRPYCDAQTDGAFDVLANPEWCSKHWCYIDPTYCNPQDDPWAYIFESRYVSDGIPGNGPFGGPDVYFSYAVCDRTALAPLIPQAGTTGAVSGAQRNTFLEEESGTTSTIVINEVADKGSSDVCDGADWIELYNAGITAVDISGYLLHDDNGLEDPRKFTFPVGTLLARGGYILLCRKGPHADADFSFEFGIGTNDQVTLLDASESALSTTGLIASMGEEDTSWARISGGVYNYTFSATPKVANVVSLLRHHPYEPPACPQRVYIIVHAYSRDLRNPVVSFWGRWKFSAELAAQDFEYTFVTTEYTAGTHAAKINEACEVADAIVVTVPYTKGTQGYAEVDGAINSCLDDKPYMPILTTNTDTYHNPRIVSYVGSNNYAIGKKCALAVFTDDERALLGQVEPNIEPLLLPMVRLLVYQRSEERSNAAITSRWLAINDTARALGNTNPPKLFHTPTDLSAHLSLLNAEQRAGAFVIALGNAALNDLHRSSVQRDFSCGDDINSTIAHYGQQVWSQGTGAVAQAIVAARAKWPAVIGNAAQVSDPTSFKASDRFAEIYAAAYAANLGTLGGVIFLDRDRDGVFNPSIDTYLEGVNVTLSRGEGYDPVTVMTDANGTYSVSVLSGSWTTTIDTSTLGNAFLVQTVGDNPTSLLDVVPGETTTDVDAFSDPEEQGTIAGVVYIDRDRNDYFTPNGPDTYLTGVTVTLFNGVTLYTLSTDANGAYSHTVPRGEWVIDIDTSTLGNTALLQTLGNNPTTVTVEGGKTVSDEDAFGYFRQRVGEGSRDPHLNFARGGRADFRGRDGRVYAFLSAPGLALNVKTEDASFRLRGDALTVDGSFITEAHLVALVGGAKQKRATVSFWAQALNDFNTGYGFVNGTCGYYGSFSVQVAHARHCEELSIKVRYSSAVFQVRGWAITVRGGYVWDRISGPRHRLDMSISARGNAPERALPHGLIGQSFSSSGPRNGKRDLYPAAGRFATSAMAEGAIEGTAAMYEVASRYATNFAFSRYDAKMTLSPLEAGSEGSGDGTASGPADVEASVHESEPTEVARAIRKYAVR